jgi:hypothetical protein
MELTSTMARRVASTKPGAAIRAMTSCFPFVFILSLLSGVLSLKL